MSDAGIISGSPAVQAAAPQVATDPAKSAKPPDLTLLKKYFDDARDGAQEARAESDIDRDYYDGHQLTPAEIRTLKRRKQPAIVINRVRRGVDGVLGVIEQGKTDPRCYMRNPPDDMAQPKQQPQPAQQMPPVGGAQPAVKPNLDAGDVASMALRFISDTTRFKSIKMDVLENILVEGSGAAIIECIGQDIMATQIRWEEHFYDPRSRKHDFSDARYQGVAKWMYADALAQIYPEKKKDLDNFASNGAMSAFSAFDQSWEDRPDNMRPWIDTKQRRVMTVEIYYLQDGIWNRCVFYANAVLDWGPSPYQDDDGKPSNPIIGQSGYVDRKNKRYGMVRDMRGPQDEINMRRSKALHEINSRQVQNDDPNVPAVDVDEVRAEAARPDGVLPPGWKIVPRSDVVANNLEMLAEAKSEIERMGPNPAILGRQGADASGRAQQIRQAAGMTELARLLGRFSDWELRIYKAMWARARQFWTDPKWVRVTDDTGAPQFVRVNEPDGQEVVSHPDIPGQQALVPKINNHISKMDVDIIVDAVPDTANLQQEIFSDLKDLAQAYGPQAVPFSIMLEMSPLPKKRELLNRLEEAQAQAAQQQAPMQQVAMTEKAAEIESVKAGSALKQAQAGLAEVQTVVAAMAGHVDATSAAQLPPGFTLGANGQHVPLVPPPPTPGVPPGASGVSGQ